MEQHEADVKELATCLDELASLIAPKLGNVGSEKLMEIVVRVRKISERKAEAKTPAKRASKVKKEG